MAYQAADLDFQGIHLAALTGSNGAGKSSLLDAITWALWGKARAKDEALVRLGSSDMEVEYTFTMHNDTYRIIRKRNVSKKSRPGDVSLQIKTGQIWRILSDNHNRQTQAKINEVMRLDYDTFINSAFLLQGRDNEFTTKPPGKRKEILSDILGLSQYDVYADRAKGRVKLTKEKVAHLEGKIGQIDEETAHQEQYQAELAAQEAEVKRLTHDRELADSLARMWYEQHRAVSEKRRHLDDLRQRVQTAQDDATYLQESLSKRRTSIQQDEALVAQRESIEQGMADLRAVEGQVEAWEAKLQESTQLTQRQHNLERQLDQERGNLQATLQGLNAKIAYLEPQVAAIDSHQMALQTEEATLASLNATQADREQQQQMWQQLATEAARLEEQQKQIRTEGETLKQKLAELQQAGAFCPVCKSELTSEHRAHAVAQFEGEIESKRGVYRQNQTRLTELDGEQTTLQQRIKTADRALQQLATVQGKIANLRQMLQTARQATTELEAATQQQMALQQQLESKAFAEPLWAELATVQTQLTALNYDAESHQQARARAAALSPVKEEVNRLAEASQRLPTERQWLARNEARLTQLQQQIETDQQTVTQLKEETANLSELSGKLSAAQTEADQLQREERMGHERVARTKQKLDSIEKQLAQRLTVQADLEQAQTDLSVYQELQLAFGKKGVQALLIENAIPEIEQEANQLLNRMTDGRMHLRFETQRETKTGDSIIETLDIRIADELGTRDYNLFSGGEAFRINFAIRIAISKVLARRAGAQLQTLIIDEGFGSQDGQGRERLVEAINRIQNDFEKVIVITHVEELKEAFPVRIEVEKTPDGSRLAVRTL